MDNKLKVSLCLGAALFCVALAGTGVRLFSGKWDDGEEITAIAGPALTMPLPSDAEAAPERKENERLAYVSGAVNNPGVYPISDESRLADLIEAAGGLRYDADVSRINLAAPVRDGAHVHVMQASFASRGQSGTPRQSRSRGSKGAAKAASQYVFINAADAGEIAALPGIGPVIAAKIVEYRARNGAFASPESLLDVSGIGPAKLKAIRALLRF